LGGCFGGWGLEVKWWFGDARLLLFLRAIPEISSVSVK